MSNSRHVTSNPLTSIAVPMEDGSWVSAKVVRIAEIITDYDPNLEVRWIPPDKRQNLADPEFCIVEHLKDGGEAVAFYVQNELEFDERVVERIFKNDSTKHNVLADMEARNAAVKAVKLKEAQDAIDAQIDFTKAVIASPLHTYRHNGKKYS